MKYGIGNVLTLITGPLGDQNLPPLHLDDVHAPAKLLQVRLQRGFHPIRTYRREEGFVPLCLVGVLMFRTSEMARAFALVANRSSPWDIPFALVHSTADEF